MVYPDDFGHSMSMDCHILAGVASADFPGAFIVDAPRVLNGRLAWAAYRKHTFPALAAREHDILEPSALDWCLWFYCVFPIFGVKKLPSVVPPLEENQALQTWPVTVSTSRPWFCVPETW